MRKKTSTIMAWLLAASVTVTSLSAGTVTAYAQEEMPLAEAGTVTESAEEFGDSSDSIADIAEEGNIEAKEKGYTCFIAAIRRSMLEAESISFLKFSSSVLIDHETVTRPSFFSRSISRTTRSDFVQIRISASLPISCSRSFLVFPNCSSCGL